LKKTWTIFEVKLLNEHAILKKIVLNFEHVNFAINGKYSKNNNNNPILCFICDFSNI
jgi:hypothetical protein